MNIRVRSILFAVLCFLAWGEAALAVHSTIGAVHKLQTQEHFVKTGDVRAIDGWMTLPYVARTCHVPEDYLYQSLHLQDTRAMRVSTLEGIAQTRRRPVGQIIHTTQTLVLTYRKSHPLPLQRVLWPYRPFVVSVRRSTI